MPATDGGLNCWAIAGLARAKTPSVTKNKYNLFILMLLSLVLYTCRQSIAIINIALFSLAGIRLILLKKESAGLMTATSKWREFPLQSLLSPVEVEARVWLDD